MAEVRTAYILVDHGSRTAPAHEHLVALAGRLALRLGATVRIAHMEIASPSIREATQRCAGQGFARVVVLPLFLSPGRHATEDIPRLVSEAAAEHPHLTVELAPILGTTESYEDCLAQLLDDA